MVEFIQPVQTDFKRYFIMANIVDNTFEQSDAAADYSTYFAASGKDSLKHAFPQKFTVHAGKSSQPLPKEEVPRQYKNLLHNLTDPAAIYIHIPFCKSRCLYCGFAGKTPKEDLSNIYIDAIIKEARYLANFEPVRTIPIRTIYFGGGTPTSMPPKALGKLMDTLRKTYNLANDCEITLEGRISDLVHAREFVDAGFNRFSIGVQSFNTKIRQCVGRINTQEEVIELLGGLINTQKAAIIIDLIYGLPGQSVEDFVSDLELAQKIGVDGLDTYQLNVFPNSKLDKAILAGSVPPAANLEDQGAYYKAAYDWLLGNRWRQLSISHYARTFRERNFYNPWAKSKGNMLALGAGAGGCLNGWSTYRLPLVEKYLEQAQSGVFYPTVMREPDARQKIHSSIVAQMEKGALNYSRLISENHLKSEPLTKVFANWRECGLITMDDQWLDLTVNGKFWGVNITQAIINILDLEN